MKLAHWFLLAAALLIRPAFALDIVPYDAGKFAQAQAEGKAVALLFHTGWCPICVMQQRGLQGLKDDKALEQVTVFEADYLKEEVLRKQYQVGSFSTLVVFHGEQERARSVGEIHAEALKALLVKAF